MNSSLKVIILWAFASVHAGIIPSQKYLEGPSSKTTIVGPDGSVISAFAPGGKILLGEHYGPMLQGAPEVVAVASVATSHPVLVPIDNNSVITKSINLPKEVEISSNGASIPVEEAFDETPEITTITAETTEFFETTTEAVIAAKVPIKEADIKNAKNNNEGLKKHEEHEENEKHEYEEDEKHEKHHQDEFPFFYSSPLLVPELDFEHNLDGHYEPVNFEKLYDDGSYKPYNP